MVLVVPLLRGSFLRKDFSFVLFVLAFLFLLKEVFTTPVRHRWQFYSALLLASDLRGTERARKSHETLRSSWSGNYQSARILMTYFDVINKNASVVSGVGPVGNHKTVMVLLQAIKSLEILDKPELIFNRRLAANPYHPFQKDHEKKFVLHLDRRRYYYGVFMACVCALIIAVWLMIGEANQYLLFPFLVGFISTLFAFDNKGDKVCTLDPATKTYSVTIGQHTLEGGEYRNVYVRLKAQKHGAGQMYYYVVFNGNHVSEYKITSYSKNDKKLCILAKRLAENLDLNFFDVKVSSKEHIIRHRPAETSRVDNRSVNSSLPV